jgi:plastocyanin domain-containing protein
VVLTVATALLVWWLSNSGTAQLAPQRAWTDNGSELPAEFVKNLEAQAVPATLAANGSAQTLDFAVNGNALTYKPKVVKVKQGVPVSMNLSVLEGRDPGCGRYVGIEGLGVHGIATPGEVSKIEFTPSKTGIFQINCNMHMMDPGYIIVTQ